MITARLVRRTAALLGALLAAALVAWGLGRALPADPPVALPLGRGLNMDIYLLDLPRGVFANLSKNALWDGDPAVSPDGRQVAYASLDGGGASLYRYDLDTGQAHRLTDGTAGSGEPHWSPDGLRLVFSASPSGSRQDIFAMNADGSGQRRLTDYPGGDYTPRWSPDGRRIAFVSDRQGNPADIYVMDADGSRPRRLTYHPGYDIRPAWSPDGAWLAFASDRDGSLNLYRLPTACLESAAGCEAENPRQLTRWGVNIGDLWWSADGAAVLFWERSIGVPELYRLEVDCDIRPGGCIPQRLTHLGRSLTLVNTR